MVYEVGIFLHNRSSKVRQVSYLVDSVALWHHQRHRLYSFPSSVILNFVSNSVCRAILSMISRPECILK